jgi:hypothetical protein
LGQGKRKFWDNPWQELHWASSPSRFTLRDSSSGLENMIDAEYPSRSTFPIQFAVLSRLRVIYSGSDLVRWWASSSVSAQRRCPAAITTLIIFRTVFYKALDRQYVAQHCILHSHSHPAPLPAWRHPLLPPVLPEKDSFPIQ